MAVTPYTYYKDLPAWAKGVVVVGVLGVGYVVFRNIIKRFEKIAKEKGEKQTVQEQEQEVKVLQQQGQKASFSKSQYLAWANSLVKAFEGCDYSGTGYFEIFGMKFSSNSGMVLGKILAQCKNDVDILELSIAFGTRTYDQCGIGTGDFTGNFASAVADELSTSEIGALNAWLTRKGFKFRF